MPYKQPARVMLPPVSLASPSSIVSRSPVFRLLRKITRKHTSHTSNTMMNMVVGTLRIAFNFEIKYRNLLTLRLFDQLIIKEKNLKTIELG